MRYANTTGYAQFTHPSSFGISKFNKNYFNARLEIFLVEMV